MSNIAGKTNPQNCSCNKTNISDVGTILGWQYLSGYTQFSLRWLSSLKMIRLVWAGLRWNMCEMASPTFKNYACMVPKWQEHLWAATQPFLLDVLSIIIRHLQWHQRPGYKPFTKHLPPAPHRQCTLHFAAASPPSFRLMLPWTTVRFQADFPITTRQWHAQRHQHPEPSCFWPIPKIRTPTALAMWGVKHPTL